MQFTVMIEFLCMCFRYLAICHPLTTHTWTKKKTHILVAIAWILSFVFALPQVFVFAYREVEPGSGVYDCWAVFYPDWTLQLYVSYIAIAIYCAPFMMLVSAYGVICYAVWHSMSVRESTRRAQQSQPRSRKTSQQNSNGVTLSNGVGEQAALMAINAPRAHTRGMPKAKLKTVKVINVMYIL